MYSNFKQQAIEYVKQAIQEDNAGNYARAFPLYMNALEYFKTHLKYEKNPKIRDAISAKFNDYLRRAEELKAVLDPGYTPPSPWPGPRPKPSCVDGDDEYGVFKQGMSCSFKEQGVEYVKQAVDRDDAGDYGRAFPLYMNALEYLKTHLIYEKDPKVWEAINGKFDEYLQRAEVIRNFLYPGGGGGSGSASNGGGGRGGDGSGSGSGSAPDGGRGTVDVPKHVDGGGNNDD